MDLQQEYGWYEQAMDFGLGTAIFITVIILLIGRQIIVWYGK